MKLKIIFLEKPVYKGFTLEQCATRPNSLDLLKRPSRIENTLFYPDGRIEYVTPTNKNN